MSDMRWSFYQIWNKSLENRPERKLEPRDRIWASELGGSMIDRYYKMKGEPFSNPPNPRSLRKFEAGNMMEWVVELVLKRAGILIDKQKWLGHQYPGLLEVSGKLDHLAGGKPDWLKAKKEIQALELPDFFYRATDGIIDYLYEKYREGLEEVVLEIKSSASFKFDRYEVAGPDIQHKLQAFHYLKASGLPEAHVVYICKDDLRMLEFGVFLADQKLEETYKNDIDAMTGYLRRDEEPPKEPMIFFEPETLKFNTSWRIEYSPYLTKVYGFKNPEDYTTAWKGKSASFNRTFGRVITGKNMTALNKSVIEEMKRLFPNYDELVNLAMSKSKDNPALQQELINESGEAAPF